MDYGSSYGSGYSNAGIDQQTARARMMLLAFARAKYNEEMKAKAEAERQRLLREESYAENQAASTHYGTMGKAALAGATIGTLIEPGGGTAVGALIGAGVGFFGGTAIEAKQRQDIAQIHGKKMSYMSALGKSAFRLPTLDEAGSLIGSGQGVAMQMGAGARDEMANAKADQRDQLNQWRMNEALAPKAGRYMTQPLTETQYNTSQPGLATMPSLPPPPSGGMNGMEYDQFGRPLPPKMPPSIFPNYGEQY